MKNYRVQEFKECCGKCENYRKGNFCGETNRICIFSIPSTLKKYMIDVDKMDRISVNRFAEIATWIEKHQVDKNGICDNFKPGKDK